MAMKAMKLSRAFAGFLSSPSTEKLLLHPVVILHSSFSSSDSVKPKYTGKPKPEPPSSESSIPESPTAPKLTQKDNIADCWRPSNAPLQAKVSNTASSTGSVELTPKKDDWPRPSEIPWQAKVANLVNLIGSIKVPVQFQASPDGKYWAGTIIQQQKISDLHPFWIPIIFEGDLAHIAACHLKENDLVYVGGQLSADPSPSTMEHGQANVQVMVQSMSFVQESTQWKKSYEPHTKGEQSFHFSAKTKDDISVKSSWNDLVSKPHEWWDNRLNKNDPTGAAFVHKENGQSLWVDGSTPAWVLLKLESLKFDYKIMQMGQKSASVKKDGDSSESHWKDLIDNPKQWQDHRKKKLDGLVKPKYPDFKHKVSGQALWLNGAPDWVCSKLHGLESDVKQTMDSKGPDEDPWKNLVENPNKWWDNRVAKVNERSPDFKHKDTGKGLWLNSSPAWVLPKLPPVNPKKVFNVPKRDTLLS